MNIKKLVGGFAAVVLASTLASVSVSATAGKPYIEERTPGKDYFLTVNSADANIPAWCKDSGIDVTEVYGVRWYIQVNDESQGFGGGVGINATANNWESHDWGNADAAKEITSDGKTVEIIKDEPVFKADDAYANFFLQNWWGDWSVVDVEVLGKDGVLLSDAVGAVAEAPAAEEEVAEPESDDEPIAVEEAPAVEAAPAAVPATENTNTGNASAVAIVSVMALAAAAMVTSRRK